MPTTHSAGRSVGRPARPPQPPRQFSPDEVDWRSAESAAPAHAFPSGVGWTRSICKVQRFDIRWIVLEHMPPRAERCQPCEARITLAPEE